MDSCVSSFICTKENLGNLERMYKVRCRDKDGGTIDCMTGVFYIWLVKSPTYAMRVNVSGKDYKNKIDSGSNEHAHIIHVRGVVIPALDPEFLIQHL